MADAEFRAQQWTDRYAPHVAPLNRLVDSLAGAGARETPPYIAPMYGGTDARLLSLLRDPGPATQNDRPGRRPGSGFLSMENDDATAERLSELFARVGIPATDIVPWNVYPWYINRTPRASELEEGVTPLKKLLDLLPRLQVVMLHGGSARDGWRHLRRRYPNIEDTQDLTVLPTYHTSRQAFWHRDPIVRTQRLKDLQDKFAIAAQIIR